MTYPERAECSRGFVRLLFSSLPGRANEPDLYTRHSRPDAVFGARRRWRQSPQCHPQADDRGSTHWRTRRLAARLGGSRHDASVL